MEKILTIWYKGLPKKVGLAAGFVVLAIIVYKTFMSGGGVSVSGNGNNTAVVNGLVNTVNQNINNTPGSMVFRR
jgi:hypothetical protein